MAKNNKDVHGLSFKIKIKIAKMMIIIFIIVGASLIILGIYWKAPAYDFGVLSWLVAGGIYWFYLEGRKISQAKNN